MTLNARSVIRSLPELKDQTSFQLMTQANKPCCVIGVEELKRLADLGHICARWRAGRILSVQLLVPTAEASIGEITRRVRQALRSDASQTTVRAGDSLPSFIRDHHYPRCNSWNSHIRRTVAA